jgi:hypothetical protein
MTGTAISNTDLPVKTYYNDFQKSDPPSDRGSNWKTA